MKSKIMWLILSCLMVAALLLASCGPAAPEEEVEEETLPSGTTIPSTLAGVGEWVNLTSDVELRVGEVADDVPAILVKWFNDGNDDFILEFEKYTVTSGTDVYVAINPFVAGSTVTIPPGEGWTHWLQFPEEAMPLEECILQYDGRPIFDLSVVAE